MANEQEALAALELVRRARAVGMSNEDIVPFYGKPDELSQEIERRRTARGMSWAEKTKIFEVRRKRTAAAYLAGASLRQLADYNGVSTNAIVQSVRKEVPTTLRERAAEERTALGRRRTPQWKPSQISAMLACATDQEVLSLPVIALAARMQAAAAAQQDSMETSDEEDPYLRNEARTTSPDDGERPE